MSKLSVLCSFILYSREREYLTPSESFEDINLASCVHEGQQTQRTFSGTTEVCFLHDSDGWVPLCGESKMKESAVGGKVLNYCLTGLKILNQFKL